MLHGKSLHLEADAPDQAVIAKLKALASVPRWRILQYLSEEGRTVGQIARMLDMPASTAAVQIKILEAAGFLRTELQPASRGLQKICFRTYDGLTLQLRSAPATPSMSTEITMPVGAYTGFSVTPTCGLASASSLIGFLDDPVSFYEPQRVEAGLLWFRSGYVEYTFPNRYQKNTSLTSVLVSMEICSEAPLHNSDWPSDITLWINDVEIGTWTCPGDFGGQRGRLTPQWWDSKDSQYGVLKRWLVTADGAFIDGQPLSKVPVQDLEIEKHPVVSVRVGVKPDAYHVGGLNLFGASFGNYPQDITLRLEHDKSARPAGNPNSKPHSSLRERAGKEVAQH
jgi:predicted transcriptional regulator